MSMPQTVKLSLNLLIGITNKKMDALALQIKDSATALPEKPLVTSRKSLFLK